MKNIIKISMLVIVLLCIFIPVNAQDTGGIYVIPVEGEVGPAMRSFIVESIDQAENNNADAIIFEINTLGGLVNNAIEISEEILNTNIPTIAFVNNKAISAGTIITIASEKIYMSPTSTIGAAETRPAEEKYISHWSGVLRTVAETRDRDPQLVASMADSDIQIEGIINKGKLLTLTSSKAIELGFIDGIAQDVEEIVDELELDSNIVKINPNFQMKIASWVTSTIITSLLVTLGFVGIIIELFSPGFGIGGVISIISFGLYFTGVLLAGLSSWIVILLFFIGFILLIIEMFVPGFGVFGIFGICSIFGSIILASKSIEQALYTISISLVITIIVLAFAIKYAPRSKFFDRLILKTKMTTENGFVGTKDYSKLIGKEGIAVTVLRPAGTIEVEGHKYDAVSQNTYIKKDSMVKVIEIEGRKIKVKEI